MRILGIDTATKFLCLGAYDGSHMYEYNLEVGKKLSSLLIPTIQRVLKTLNWRMSGIDYFACGLGPGSFTGMRTGLSTIKGLCWVLNKPLIGISTLDILAKNIRETDKPIIPIVDAKRNLIYCSIFKNKNRKLQRTRPYLLLGEEELFSIIKPDSIILGDAISLYKEKLQRNLKGIAILEKDYWYPKAHNIIELALERIKYKKFDNISTLKPIYLYPKECQIKSV